ncbi:unnamed protein product [Durusdinium trenchii]|uniref:EGF-like domain-containing protein n=1 Tax=Durusdinium trenchii TaxID=1381693 RepID=A0ABP0MDY0_9DINO
MPIGASCFVAEPPTSVRGTRAHGAFVGVRQERGRLGRDPWQRHRASQRHRVLLWARQGCVYRFSRRSTPSVVNVWPLHGASLDAEAPTVRIIVAGWDGSKADAEVFFGSQQCEVNLTKRLVQPCPECGQGHCISNVLNADMAAVAGEMAQSAVACKCNDGWYGENCGKPCTCVYPGTLSCDDGANGDGTCTCADLHNGTNCELCDMGPGTENVTTVQSENEVGARTLLGAPGIATRSKNATRSKGHRY